MQTIPCPGSVQDIALSQRENIRRHYRPARVKLLFIGEAPPASGRFFYRCNSGLYRAFLECFRTVLPTVTDADFLSVFQSLGCYLVDLCPIPVDRLVPKEREQIRLESEILLSQAISEIEPQRIATVMRAIRPNAERAAHNAGWSGALLDLPYPGRWSGHRATFIEMLKPELDILLQQTQS